MRSHDHSPTGALVCMYAQLRLWVGVCMGPPVFVSAVGGRLGGRASRRCGVGALGRVCGCVLAMPAEATMPPRLVA